MLAASNRSRAAWTRALLLPLLLAGPGGCLSRQELFPFGPAHGDLELEDGDDLVSPALELSGVLRFYDRSDIGSVYVTTNGIIATNEPPAEESHPGLFPPTFGAVAPFLADLDTTDGLGKVYYREDFSPSVTQRAAECVQRGFPEISFQPSTVVVVTWESVAPYQGPSRDPDQEGKRNTFQAVLASSDSSSYAIFLYPEDGLQFHTTFSKKENNQVPAVVAFSQGSVGYLWKSNGAYNIFANDRESIENLAKSSNSGQQGVWVFEIGSPATTSGVVPADVILGTEDGAEYDDEDEDYVLMTTRPGLEDVGTTPFPYKALRKGGADTYSVPSVLSPHRTATEKPLGPPTERTRSFQLAVETFHQQHPQVLDVDEVEETGVVFSYNTDSRQTCANNRHQCSVHAECRDYATGFCCSCVAGYMGNGRQCVAEGNLLFYVHFMREKEEWSFCFGASFPCCLYPHLRRCGVFFLRQRCVVSLSSFFLLFSTGIPWGGPFPVLSDWSSGSLMGRECQGAFKAFDSASCILNHLPFVSLPCPLCPSHSAVITSSSTREYTVTEPERDGAAPSRIYTYQWRQTITFQECVHDDSRRALPSTQQLSVDSVFVLYNQEERILRYALSNSIGPVREGSPDALQNPCYIGTHGCDTNAACRPGSRTQFTCECSIGFRGDGRTCYDIDECSEQPSVCGSHAICNNHPGTFRCECVEGYQFSDEGKCVAVVDQRPINYCATGLHDCDIPQRARCVYTGGSSYTCSCLPGFSGDGRACQDVDECQPSRCHPDAFCYNTPGSFTCQCKPGYQGDGFRCVPGEVEKTRCQHEREHILGAAAAADPQRPIPLGLFVPECDEHGHYAPTQCHGSTGYCWCVDRDGREVEGTRTRPGMTPPCLSTVAPPIHQGPAVPTAVIPLPPGTHLLFAQTGKIERLPLEGNTMRKTEAKVLLHVPAKVIIGLAFDCVDRMVYWTDISEPSIGRASLHGGEPTIIIRQDLGSPEGIALDHLGRNIFWTDSNLDRIEVAKLDGTQRRVLFETDLVNPRGIVTDSVRGNLYWTDWNRDNPKIETSYMDGTNRRILVQDDLGLPNGLTFDAFSSQLCWVDAGTNRAECLNPTQPSRRRVLEGLHYPFAVTSFGKNLYYTDWKMNSVVALDLAISKEMDAFHPHKQTRLYGITTALSQCPQGHNYCSVNNGGCTHLCLATPGSRTCRCPDNTLGVDCIERK
ncbi:nidogen-1 [Sapajus apella]|uniref:Nidogen-1 n=1 Tax=Sapajus apella TaxID=9515 RepID=A0A6J3EXV8_SAPAP|nr:nidogen-1 [Sapajus apella]